MWSRRLATCLQDSVDLTGGANLLVVYPFLHPQFHQSQAVAGGAGDGSDAGGHPHAFGAGRLTTSMSDAGALYSFDGVSITFHITRDCRRNLRRTQCGRARACTRSWRQRRPSWWKFPSPPGRTSGQCVYRHMFLLSCFASVSQPASRAPAETVRPGTGTAML